MELENFINEKRSTLEQQYKKVEFKLAESVVLGKNSVSSEFISKETPLNKEGEEVSLSSLGEATTVPFVPNGTLVRFYVFPPRKRKPTFKDFYFLWN